METFPFLITAETAVALALLQAFLMFRVGNYRAKVDVPLGLGGDAVLERRVRAHGNLTENAPLVLILLALTEYAGGATLVIGIFAALFVIARLSHAFAISAAKSPLVFRALGALGTLGSIAGLAITLLVTVLLPATGM